MQPVNMPALHFAGPNRELINVNQRRRVNTPGWIQNLAQGAAFIGVSDGAPDNNTMNPSAKALAIGSHSRQIFDRLRRKHLEFLGRLEEKTIRKMRRAEIANW